MEALLVLGNQLFPRKYLQDYKSCKIFMAEDMELCTYFKFHKHKIILFLSAMRHYRDELKEHGFDVEYHELQPEDSCSYEERLNSFIKKNKVSKIHYFEIEDRFMEERLQRAWEDVELPHAEIASPMFVTSRPEFKSYLNSVKKPFMKTFYERQRKRLKILMDDGEPIGGKFSYDDENRKKMPKSHCPPEPLHYQLDEVDRSVCKMVEQVFSDHPGQVDGYWLPATRRSVLAHINHFFKHRFEDFGPYQDAIEADQWSLHHSLVSPAMNMGLVTPDELIAKATESFREADTHLPSVEGFVRQVLGWREFVRGVYQNYSEKMQEENYWQHTRKMKPCWYEAKTGLPPVDDAIQHALERAYCHHIERLMVLANIMNLCEIAPKQVHSWFMEMFADSSDWVMGPNVYGMGLMSDGGIFATKPYISGSNYILKMSHYAKGPWCDVWDGLYWRFVDKHQEFFSKNPRMKMMLGTLSKMKSSRKETIFQAADDFLEKTTHT